MIRKATVVDIKELHKFLVDAAKDGGEILPRPLNDLYHYVRDYWVYRKNKDAPIIATTALHICWDDLAEVRNLYVKKELRGKGLGEQLVWTCIEEAKKLGVGKVFALTYRPGFFVRIGFAMHDRTQLPNKIWVDCLNCMKFPECDEDAVMFDLEVDKFVHIKKPPRKKKAAK